MASKLCVGVFAATASLSLFGCGSDDKPADDTQTIAELVVGNKDLSVLKTALVAANLVDTFNKTDGDKFTVFAPTNDAFYKHNATVNCLLFTDTMELPNVLKYHVVKDAIESSDLKNESVPTLLDGESLKITVSGKSVMVNEAMVTTADIAASNGEVHLIDDVLIPSNFDAGMCPTESIVGTAQSVKTLSTLVAALTAADLVDLFNTVDLGVVYTVFAPNDDAFAKVDDVVKCLLLPENKDKLVEILEYHVATGYTLSSALSDGQSISTLDMPQNLTVSIKGGSVMINDATVLTADVNTTNGVVHVIDSVLVPPGFQCGKSHSVMV
jgi:uncharacterized surface protein with fasciclin (FAS1) repeats